MVKKINVFGNSDWIKNSQNSSFKNADIVIMPGGGDWNPALYGHETAGTYGFSKSTDDRQMDMINESIEKGKLLFGICRGVQGLTIRAGGFLIQDVKHPSRHSVKTFDGRFYGMNSCHHQMCYPYQLNIDDYEVLAWTRELSPYYTADEKANLGEFPKEALDDDGKFKEPEVIWYPKINALGCQGHPEWGPGEEALNFLNELIIEKLNK